MGATLKLRQRTRTLTGWVRQDAVGSATLSAHGVGKTFVSRGGKRTTALADIDLEIEVGEFVAILGPSGCGKTTLMRLLAGLERTTTGDIRLGGSPVQQGDPRTGVVFQSSVLLPWRSILSNVMLPGEVRHIAKPQVQQRARELLRMVALAEYENHYPRELSGGMRQRASICRALLLDPAILFMDEPFGALDAITRWRLNRELYELWRSTQKTVVFITHDIVEAVRMASRAVVLGPPPCGVVLDTAVELSRGPFEERLHASRFQDYVTELDDAIAVADGTKVNVG